MVNETDRQRRARARARAVIAGEAARLMLENKLSLRMATKHLRLRGEKEAGFLETIRAATGRKAGRPATLAVQSIARWLRLSHGGDGLELASKPTRYPNAPPEWFASFLSVLRPRIPMAYRLWVESGIAPTPTPTLRDVYLALRRARGNGRVGQ